MRFIEGLFYALAAALTGQKKRALAEPFSPMKIS
jgi:hypothetical protein